MNTLEKSKEVAAYAAVDEEFMGLLRQKRTETVVLGIGSGSTIVYAVERLVQYLKKGEISAPFVCIPTSFQARALVLDHKLPLADLEQYPSIDVTIDGADEVDADRNCIKGGGGCHTQEKIVAFNSKRLIIVADHRKVSKQLGQNWKQGVPLEVLSMAYKPVMNKIVAIGGKPTIRMAKSKAGPCISDNGNMIIDADFGVIEDPAKLNEKLIMIPGNIETGLFVQMAHKVYFGSADGSTFTVI
ncbi:hypothetical protein MP638_000712 [Amoeboaphelidium occidentale]|nr:hypothetical protein MP638_000712 [Amoeboaphelidium occidentale]